MGKLGEENLAREAEAGVDVVYKSDGIPPDPRWQWLEPDGLWEDPATDHRYWPSGEPESGGVASQFVEMAWVTAHALWGGMGQTQRELVTRLYHDLCRQRDLGACDSLLDALRSTGDSTAEISKAATPSRQPGGTPDELLRYVRPLRALFHLYHGDRDYDVVLYDKRSGEVVLDDEE